MSLQMIQARVTLPALYRWAGRRDLMSATFDEGFALHCLLNSSFGEGTLRPFRLMYPRGASDATLYAYSDFGQQQLDERADNFAEPEFRTVVHDIQSKAMPDRFAQGRQLGFDLKVRPVRRRTVEGSTKQRERDAYLCALDVHERADVATSVSREQVYMDWLAERLQANGALLDRESTGLKSFQRTQVIRQRQQRKGIEGPEVIVQGQLTVSDSEQFQHVLARGVGRHCGYGYGMLLLRPPRKA